MLCAPSLPNHARRIAASFTNVPPGPLKSLTLCLKVSHVQVRQLVETLRCCAHQAFPITPDVRRAYDSAEPFDLHGIVLRGTLLRLIQHRVGFFSPDASGEIPSARAHIPTTQSVRPQSRTIVTTPRDWDCAQHRAAWHAAAADAAPRGLLLA